MRMRLFGAAILTLAACAGWASVKVSVNTQNGQAIKGTHSFRATAQSEKLVTSVEFYVNDSLRGTDESTPYEFTIDTLQEDDGDLNVRFDAYTEDGDKGTVTLKLKVDNGVALGLKHHLDKGMDALADSRWDDAIYSGRVALKVDEKSLDAKAILARANYGKGVKDLAQKYLEDVLAIDPNNAQALLLLSAIQIDLAFDSVSSSSANRGETVALISASLKRAAENRAKTLSAAVDALPADMAPSDPKRIAVLMEAARYNAVIQALSPLANGDKPDTGVMNSLIYALIRNGQPGKAAAIMRHYEKFGSPDGYGYALKAILMQYAGLDNEAKDAEKEALLSDPSSAAVKTAQAYMALKRGDAKVFGQIANELGASEAPAHISGYFVSSLLLRAGEFQPSLNSIRAALKSEPAAYDIYVERAIQIMAYTFTEGMASDEIKFQRDVAIGFLNAALAIKPESFQALACLSLIHGFQGEFEKAATFGEAASKAGPEYGPGWYAFSAAQMGLASAARLKAAGLPMPQKAEDRNAWRKAVADIEKDAAAKAASAKAAVDKAAQYDPYNFRGRTIPPSIEIAWNYFIQHGRLPLMPSS